MIKCMDPVDEWMNEWTKEIEKKRQKQYREQNWKRIDNKK